MIPFYSDENTDDKDYHLFICGSMNRNQIKMNELFNALNPINVGRIAGSGNKVIYMLDQ
jgi:hypothetical protein